MSERTPRVQEELTIDKRSRETGRVRIEKTTTNQEVPVRETVVHEGYEVRRVPRNLALDSAPQPRREGDTLVLPVVEERLIKQLVLVEEIRLTPRRREETVETNVRLRREEVEIDRLEPELRKETS